MKIIMVAVITGASSGIGKETARLFAAKGWQVICLSRTPCDIKGVKSLRCNITKQEDIDAAFSQIEGVDLLINNAGFGVSGCAEFMEMSEIRSQFELNFFAHVAVTKAALPMLRKSKGRIIFTSSAAAIFSIPFQSFYSATKSAIESLTCALANELKAFGISVCAVRLGDVKTGFTAARQKDFAGDDIYGGMISKSVSVMENDEIHGMKPEEIAAAVMKVAQKKKPPVIVTVGTKYKLFCFLAKILPQNTANKIVGSMYMPK
uniref:SDR family NAD(P)-dependent oxidoreductase n=1 Tax=Eubacterium sp. TaxID=142586 RepID=UPI003FEFCCB9